MGTSADMVEALKERYSVRFRGVFENEVPARRLSVGDFRLDRWEVTNARFARFLATNRRWRKDALPAAAHNGHYLEEWTGDRYPDGQGGLPVVFVTWHAAQAYCRWAGGRLPTEAEWEYAARSGGNAEFPWGDAPPTPERANYSSSGHGRPVAVGSYPANPLGLFDMAGNVWELLADAWAEHYADHSETDPAAGEGATDDQLLAVRGRRSIRGGSFAASIVNLRTRWRDSHDVTNAVGFVGFRCAYSAVK
jgi:formylglycine-generating enzyme required for sulfatase activity